MPRLTPRIPPSSSLSSLFAARAPHRLWTCSQCSTNPLHSRKSSTTTQSKPQSFPAPSSKPFYVTSPIFYVNAAPHIGHLYSTVHADVLKRWALLRGHSAALLTTGTDEHGLKVQKAAQAAGEGTQEFCDAGAELFRELCAAGDVGYDFFSRTSDWRHKNAVTYAWQQLAEKGWVYKDEFEGWYSVSDETFYPESKVRLGMDPVTGRKRRESVETGSVVEWTSETNYRFKLSQFQDKLLQFYKENPEWITPSPFMKMIVQEVESGLSDLSISRPSERVQWGIVVPDDPSQTVYVWLDALLNYAVQMGYPNGNYVGNGWPADVHVIGKDILRFHCIYWPAFLMALEVPLPKRVLSHAHWTLGNKKMSKSRGNVVNPFYLLDTYGSDVVRWHLIYDGGLADDADFDRDRLMANYKILSDGIGNMLARIMRNKFWDVDQAVTRTWRTKDAIKTLKKNKKHAEMLNHLEKMRELVEVSLGNMDSKQALKEVLSVVHAANAWFHACEPWTQTVRGADGEVPSMNDHVSSTIGLAAEVLRICGIGLIPYMPNKANLLLDELAVEKDKRTWQYAAIGEDTTYGKVKSGDLKKGYGSTLFPRATEYIIPGPRKPAVASPGVEAAVIALV